MGTPEPARFLTADAGHGPALRGGYSAASGKHHFPLAARCPFTGASDVVEVALPETGRLRYWTVVRTAPGYFGPVPYGLGVVAIDGIELEILTRLAIQDEAEVTLGTPMRLALERLPGPDEDALTLWQFVPVAAGR